MTDYTSEIDKVLAQACTDAIAAIVPAGEYPVDSAIIAKARNELKKLMIDLVVDCLGAEELSASVPPKLPDWLFHKLQDRDQLRQEAKKRLKEFLP